MSGRVRAAHYVLTRRGRVVEARDADAAPPLSPAHRRALARLARRTAKAFDAPQDVEWAIDTDGKLWLLQSRPVTAVAEPGSGPLLGPGPVAETFPVPLRALEQDLFLEPLREGIVRSLVATNAVTPHRLRESPVLTAVGGRVAVDLELLGIVQGRRSKWRLLDPRPGLRRLRAAWQVGRLRTALPDLVTETVDRIDADLTGVGPLDALDDDALLDVLDATRRELATAHSFEVLVGMLRREEPTGAPAAAVALRALARGRRDGLTDDAIVARDPVVLALVPPSLDGPVALPQEAATHGRAPADVGAIDARDALRLRSRWIQELLVRVARELGDRLVARGTIASARSVRDLTLDELHDLVDGAPAPADLDERAARPDGPPLPPAFRLTEHGAVAPKRVRGHETEGTPAGGGRGEGWVRHRAGVTDRPTVLVVRHLEPQLASALPGLAGLASETGSPLSHLAILAREFGVPTVVAVDDACRRFPPGTVLLVDGTTGEVRALDDESQGSAR